MFKVLVILQVNDFQALDEFEKIASKVMASYHGKIVCAFETIRNEDGSGEEVHIVEFRSEDDFCSYKIDPRLQELCELRERAISHTEVKSGTTEKLYS